MILKAATLKRAAVFDGKQAKKTIVIKERFPALDAFPGAFFVIYWINERILEFRSGEAMIRAVVFDMFETLVTLFEGRTYSLSAS